jgi:glycosyltransferase involved in cell wall biosynthesis
MFSFATTTYNETLKTGNGSWFLECLKVPIEDDRVTEIVVSDDCSSDYDALCKLVAHLPKVKMFRLPENRGPFGNKIESVRRSTCDWVIIGDSDNTITPDYLRVASENLGDPTRLLCPTYAAPNFDYRHMGGQIIGPGDFARMTTEKLFWCFVNTGNWVLNRQRFNQAFDRFFDKPRFDHEQPDYLAAPWRSTLRHRQVYDSADSFYINRTWLMADPANRMFAVPDLIYEHRWRRDSTYDRGGPEKEMLIPVYYYELLDFAKGERHNWRVLGRGHDANIILQKTELGVAVGSPCDVLHLNCHDYHIVKTERKPKL